MVGLLLLATLFVFSQARLAPLLYASPESAIRDNYIVVYKDDVSIEALHQELATLAHRSQIVFTYQHTVKGYSAKNLTAVQVAAIRENPLVKFIEEDQIVKASACVSPVSVNSWGLTRIAERKMSLDGKYSFSSNAGTGVNAYVIDTGIYVANVEFGGRAIFGWKADSSWSNSDGNGHGTHVAGTIIGTKFGVARRATAIAVKVLGDDGSGTNSGVIAGVEWVITTYRARPKPSVINMSLGGGLSSVLNSAVNAAVTNGIVVVVAAGNSNTDACKESPSSASSVVSVGATDIGLSSSDVRSYFSNYGSCVDIFAPGSDITSAWIGSTTAINTISGTSMASPHVAGVACLLLGDSPSTSAKDIQASLLSLATPGLIELQCSNSACRSSPNLMLYNGCSK